MEAHPEIFGDMQHPVSREEEQKRLKAFAKEHHLGQFSEDAKGQIDVGDVAGKAGGVGIAAGKGKAIRGSDAILRLKVGKGKMSKAAKLIDDRSSLIQKETTTKGGGRRKSAFAEEVFDPESVVYGSLTLTVIVCVWKLLLVVVTNNADNLVVATSLATVDEAGMMLTGLSGLPDGSTTATWDPALQQFTTDTGAVWPLGAAVTTTSGPALTSGPNGGNPYAPDMSSTAAPGATQAPYNGGGTGGSTPYNGGGTGGSTDS